MVIEDVGVFGIIFLEKYKSLSVEECLWLYEKERKLRVMRL